MFCKNCGTKVSDGVKFCPTCGSAVASVEPETSNENYSSYSQPSTSASTYSYNAPDYDRAEQSRLAGNIMIFGILGLALSVMGVSALLGIIFSAIAMSKANEYVARYGELTGRAKIGRRLAKPGIICGIVFGIIVAFYIFFYVLMILSMM